MDEFGEIGAGGAQQDAATSPLFYNAALACPNSL
jgi:hypothetical protein